jgi:hypothetical protein
MHFRASGGVSVWVIPTDEERTIVRQTLRAIRTAGASRPSAAKGLISDAVFLEKQA